MSVLWRNPDDGFHVEFKANLPFRGNLLHASHHAFLHF
jgi:hypothetical protein